MTEEGNGGRHNIKRSRVWLVDEIRGSRMEKGHGNTRWNETERNEILSPIRETQNISTSWKRSLRDRFPFNGVAANRRVDKISVSRVLVHRENHSIKKLIRPLVNESTIQTSIYNNISVKLNALICYLLDDCPCARSKQLTSIGKRERSIQRSRLSCSSSTIPHNVFSTNI